jgi:hypothetical protein
LIVAALLLLLSSCRDHGAGADGAPAFDACAGWWPIEGDEADAAALQPGTLAMNLFKHACYGQVHQCAGADPELRCPAAMK